jgi:hypothetical protein
MLSNEHEDAFAEEAQEAAIIAEERHSHATVETQFDVRDGVDDEMSPLMNTRQRTKRPHAYVRAGASFERAVNEPWHGAHGAGELPWYKKPSVYDPRFADRLR